MKIEEIQIEEIQNVIAELRNELSKHELLPVMLRANDALDALEKMKPTTITDDPATWPPEEKEVLYYNGDSYCIGGRWDKKTIHRTHHIFPDIRISVGDQWQYLPEWEG
jgi:hypothetical protein